MNVGAKVFVADSETSLVTAFPYGFQREASGARFFNVWQDLLHEDGLASRLLASQLHKGSFDIFNHRKGQSSSRISNSRQHTMQNHRSIHMDIIHTRKIDNGRQELAKINMIPQGGQQETVSFRCKQLYWNIKECVRCGLKKRHRPFLFIRVDCDTYISIEATNEPQQICGGGERWHSEIYDYKTI